MAYHCCASDGRIQPAVIKTVPKSTPNPVLSAHVRVHTQEPAQVSKGRVARHQLFGDHKPLDVVTQFSLLNSQGQKIFSSTPIVEPFYGQKNILRPNPTLSHDFVHKMILTNPYVPNAKLGALGEMLEGVSSINRYQVAQNAPGELPKGLPLHRVFPVIPAQYHPSVIRRLTHFFSKGIPTPLNPEMVVKAYQAMKTNYQQRPDIPLYELQQEKAFLRHLRQVKVKDKPMDYAINVPPTVVSGLFTNYENVLNAIKHFGHYGTIPTRYLSLLFKSNRPKPTTKQG
jgi:hypothetical protein